MSAEDTINKPKPTDETAKAVEAAMAAPEAPQPADAGETFAHKPADGEASDAEKLATVRGRLAHVEVGKVEAAASTEKPPSPYELKEIAREWGNSWTVHLESRVEHGEIQTKKEMVAEIEKSITNEHEEREEMRRDALRVGSRLVGASVVGGGATAGIGGLAGAASTSAAITGGMAFVFMGLAAAAAGGVAYGGAKAYDWYKTRRDHKRFGALKKKVLGA